MKNKKKFAFLTLAVTMGMVLGACHTQKASSSVISSSNGPVESSSSAQSSNNTSSSSSSAKSSSSANSSKSSSSVSTSSSSSSSSIPQVNKYTVRFLVDGNEVQSGQVEEGQLAAYNGATPTKAGDENAVKYRFKGWDRDLSQPILQNTDINAVFASYALQQIIDDFEGYSSNGDMADAGWKALGYHNDTQTWDDQTAASVSLGTKSVEGLKALRFDAWENGVGYKFAKDFTPLSKSANALKFRLQVPSINTVKVILKGEVTIAGTLQKPTFTYTINPTSSEYVEYTIPIAADGWALWGKAGDTIKEKATWIGIHEDDFVNYMTGIEFYVQGNDHGQGLPYFAFLDSVRFVTLDEPVAVNEVETMGNYSTYTGLLTSGYTVKVQLGDNGSGSATILDAAPAQQTIPGSYTVDAQKVMTFRSVDGGSALTYKAKLVNGGQSMEFIEATGAFADEVEGMDLSAVQVVDNYEQYATDGQAYYKDHGIDERSGCRGAYYSEYYAGEGNSAPFGGNKWSLLGGDGSQLKLKQNGGHSGLNYLCLKHSKSVAFRYMQWGLFDGTAEQNNFRGSKFSFWAKTSGYVNEFKVGMYSQSKPTLATVDQRVKQYTFSQEAAIADWTHFEINLDPNLTYYGFMISIDKNITLSANEAYLYIDDVEVYTANPYAEYTPEIVPQETELENGQVFFASIRDGMVSAGLVIGPNNTCLITIPASNLSGTATYTMDDDRQVTFDLGMYGTYVARLSQDGKSLAHVSATGIANSMGEFNFTAVDVLDNAETYENSGNMYYQNMTNKDGRSGARGAYYCEYYTGNVNNTSPVGGSKWSLMGGSGDQLSLSTEQFHSGSQSLKLKRNNSGNAMRYMTWGLMDGTAEGHTGAEYFIYFVKNPNEKAATIKTSVYYQSQVTASTQQSNRAYVEAEIPANSDWTPIVITLDPTKTYYGVAYSISGMTASAADYLYIDDAMFYSEANNVTAPFLAIPGLTMSGTIAGGAMQASITLGQGRNAVLTCQPLGGDVDAKFTLMGTTMVIEVPALQSNTGTTITGTYQPSETPGMLAFTVVSATGELAPYIAAGTVFSGPRPNTGVQ